MELGDIETKVGLTHCIIKCIRKQTIEKGVDEVPSFLCHFSDNCQFFTSLNKENVQIEACDII